MCIWQHSWIVMADRLGWSHITGDIGARLFWLDGI
jgi:hypothetical protein